MSKAFRAKLRYPRCNKFQHAQLWDSVNVTIDPDLKEHVFNALIKERKDVKSLRVKKDEAPVKQIDIFNQ